MKKGVAILTNNLNCERHIQYYSRIERYFLENGWEIREDFDVDKVIICACGFHDLMHEKVVKTLEHLGSLYFLEKNIVIMGCQTRTHEEELKKTFKGHIIHFYREESLDRLIDAKTLFENVALPNTFRPHKESGGSGENEFFYIKISQGCLKKCTFCVINKAKGLIRSVPKERIGRLFSSALDRGYRKIHLMGEDTFAYGIDADETIIDLVDYLLDIESDVELYFGSLHIQWLKKYGARIQSLCRRGVVKELHIGLQHVDDQLLEKMGRPVAFGELYEIIKTLKRENPDLFLGVDILVGFPGETEEIFLKLVKFFEQDRCFNIVRHFGFSDVKGAPSYHFDDKIPAVEVIRRWEVLDEVLCRSDTYCDAESQRHADKAYEATKEKDFFFCKDTFLESADINVQAGRVETARSIFQDEDKKEFEF